MEDFGDNSEGRTAINAIQKKPKSGIWIVRILINVWKPNLGNHNTQLNIKY